MTSRSPAAAFACSTHAAIPSLRDDVIGGYLDLFGESFFEAHSQTHWSRRVCGNRLESYFKSMPAEHGRMQTARHGAQLVERDGDLAPRPIEPSRRLGVTVHLLLKQTQLEREGDEALLSTVVEVAFQPLSLLLARFDHPRA